MVASMCMYIVGDAITTLGTPMSIQLKRHLIILFVAEFVFRKYLEIKQSGALNSCISLLYEVGYNSNWNANSSSFFRLYTTPATATDNTDGAPTAHAPAQVAASAAAEGGQGVSMWGLR